ncbi:hypothetical protein Tco_1334829 [Tanacetum coccineum]
MNDRTGAQKPENIKHEDVGGMIKKDIPKEEYVGPFKVLKYVRSVAYKLELPQELKQGSQYISCIKPEKFVEEPIEIVDCEVKLLKRSHIPLVKVRWNSKRGPEFTWEREDQFQKKYP